MTVIVSCCNLIVDGGRFLLVRESKASARQRYNLPAGKLEAGETVSEAAVREAREETGLTVVAKELVGLYHCPQTSEGFGVVNVVFASSVVGGELTPSAEHPEVRYFSRSEIDELGGKLLLRGTHIARAIEDFERGNRLPLELIQLVAPSPLR
jgi:8-oxo-dGTP diphosphatase